MKTLLSALFVLAMVQGMGQKPTAKIIWATFSQTNGGKAYYDTLSYDSIKLSTARTIPITEGGINSIVSLTVTTNLSKQQPKYDTIRVFIVYADTDKIPGVYFNNTNVHAIDPVNKMMPVTITDVVYTNNGIRWAFAYSVKEQNIFSSYRVFNTKTNKEENQYQWVHIKYLTENKKPIPTSWVILPNSTIELK